jgi:hypothetical protein
MRLSFVDVEKLRKQVEKARRSQHAFDVLSSGDKVVVGLPLNRLDLFKNPVALALTRCDLTTIRAMQLLAAELSAERLL